MPEGEEVEVVLEGVAVAKGTTIVQKLFQQAIDVFDHRTGSCRSIQQFDEAVSRVGELRSGSQECVQVLLGQLQAGTKALGSDPIKWTPRKGI